MLAINMDDVINVLNSCKPYLIALGVVLALAIVVTVACMKLKKPVKKLVRKEAWIAFLLAVVVIVNLICFIPMSSMISLAMGNGTITDETSDESTALVQEIAEEGIVLLKNDGTLPLAADSIWMGFYQPLLRWYRFRSIIRCISYRIFTSGIRGCRLQSEHRTF